MNKFKHLTITLGLFFALTAGASAQSIIFTSLDGDKIDVEAQREKVVVMGIGASWLPLSEDQAATINKLARKYEGRDDVVFYFIATDSSSQKSKNYASDEDIRKFAKQNKLNVTILRDEDGKQTTQKYKLDQLPAFIILDKEGKPAGDPISGTDPFAETDTADLISNKVDELL